MFISISHKSATLYLFQTVQSILFHTQAYNFEFSICIAYHFSFHHCSYIVCKLVISSEVEKTIANVFSLYQLHDAISVLSSILYISFIQSKFIEGKLFTQLLKIACLFTSF
ncbi:MAG: hypothetical protein P1U46_03635 [Patescibacteria group bacterium]|nr:hypothetical protein [Patescibacteria group bacterium]